MEMDLPATPTPADSRGMQLAFQSPTADAKAQQSLRIQAAAAAAAASQHAYKKRAACGSPRMQMSMSMVSQHGHGHGLMGTQSPQPVATCNFAALSRHFHLPLKVAAEKFGVRATAFKKRCRAIGIRHWPYRKVRSLKRSLQELEQCQQQAQDGTGPPLSDKQLRQHAGYQSQLTRLLSPETYGIDPYGQTLPANFFHTGNDGGLDGNSTPDDHDAHDSDEDSCGSQSPRLGVCERFARQNKARKHLFTDSPSSASASPHRDGGMFFGGPMTMNPAADYMLTSRSNYSQPGSQSQISGNMMAAQPGLAFDAMYDPFGEMATGGMDPYGDNDHPSCGYSLDNVSYDFFPLNPSPTMAMRRATSAPSVSTSASSGVGAVSNSVAPSGLEGLEDDIFRHISPEYGCLV